MKSFLLSAAAVLTLSVSGFAYAQSAALKPDEIIATRQAGMAMTGWITDAMKAGVASGADPKSFAEGAEAMAKWGRAYPALFPDGTQTGHETKAKPEIWTDRAGFEKAAAAYVTATDALTAAAKSGDKAAFAAAFTDEGKSCGGVPSPVQGALSTRALKARRTRKTGAGGGQNSTPSCARTPAAKWCFTSVISVTRSAAAISAGRALRPVTTTCSPGGRAASPASTAASDRYS